ncbi:MAG: hemW [Bacteroidetes bacterium]|nr:hemW [Bacteroidota bacterium]
MAGIYIHIPFCKQACHYCNFYFSTSLAQKENLVGAIIKEIELSKDYLTGETIETIYFGGGTPSLLEVSELKAILDTIYMVHPKVDLKELTLEANPDDLTAAKIADLASLKTMGLNRLSIGVQSFFDADLIYMNRAHNSGEAQEAIKRAQDAGFSDLTIDLIYGTPTMSDENWLANIHQAFALGIPHISSYALTVEAKTNLDRNIKKGKSQPVDEAQSSRQFDILMREMAAHGYDQYEISNFSLPGKHAIHNTNYWRGQKYLGLGPSAHSFDGASRRWNVANNQIYIKSINEGQVPFEVEHLTPAQQANEYIMTSLRTMWGTDLDQFQILNFKFQIIEALEQMDPALYSRNGNIIKLTQQGKHFADHIASDLFIDE